MNEHVDLQLMLEHLFIPRDGYKKCRICKIWKEKEKFYAHKLTRDKLGPYCISCTIEKTRVQQINNPEAKNKVARKRYAKNAGVIVEDIDIWYEEQLARQDGKCAICSLPANKNRHKRLYMDHDHITGKFRGLLCHSCNVFLGRYEKIKSAVEVYLKQET